MSRRAELTSELIAVIETEVQRAHFPEVVAKKLGVHKKLWNEWLKQGERAHVEDTDAEPGDDYFMHRQLYERIEEAEAFAEMELLNMAREQAELGRPAWNGFLTTLERRFSDRWRKRDATSGDLSETWDAQVRKHLLAQRANEAEKLRAVK